MEQTPGGLLVRSLGPYGSPLGDHIQRLKYRQETFLARRLGRAMAQVLPAEWGATTLIPVPLHPERLAERGYNQSALLARRVGKQRGLRIEFELLRRTKSTEPQAQLSYLARKANAENAFVFSGEPGPAAYLLVDDVVTTGNTVDACRAALERAGALVVGVLAAATGGGLTEV